MKLLAIDTSTDVASVALLVGDELRCDEQGGLRTHAQLLLPMIDKLLINSGVLLSQLDGIVFGCGPGSFTGLRIACSIAKGLAYAHDLPLYPVSSLAAIVSAVREQKEYTHCAVLALIDARMNELYWGYYGAEALIVPDRVTPVEAIELPQGQSVVLAGVGIETYWPAFPEALKPQVITRLTQYPLAMSMIHLVRHAKIKPVLAAHAEPVYVRNQVTQGDARG